MKLKTLFILLLLHGLAFGSALAQRNAELEKLIGVAKLLREPGQASYDKALSVLNADSKWTPMNETGVLQPGECSLASLKGRFKLNRILTTAERGRKYVSTHGDMLNGEDERYNYSLYERALKAGGKATYSLKGRQGAQTFVIVPFEPASKLVVTINGQQFAQPDAEGVLHCQVPKGKVNGVATVTVENKGSQPVPFVIINYNSRQK